MRKLLILWTILAFCVSAASALQVSSPNLAGEPGANVSSTFTITNDANYFVTRISVSSTADSIHNIQFENAPSSLAPNQSASVIVKGAIPSDFAFGKRSIGTITATATTVLNAKIDIVTVPFGSHTFVPQSQTPQSVTLPVAMSAANECGQNTPDPGMPIIGQWHSGTCDGVNDITVKQPFEGAVDGGWVRIHSANYSDYWVGAVAMNCGGQTQDTPKNWINGGKIQTGPALCDNQIELQSGDAGWVGLYTKPEADGALSFVVAENKCGGSVESVPSGGVVLGKVSTGPGVCDGKPEGTSYNGLTIDAGSMYVVYVPIDHTPKNFVPIGEFEKLDSRELSGWAFDNDTSATAVRVYVDGSSWKELVADRKNSDAFHAGKIPDKNHGFRYEFSDHDLEAFGNGNHTFNVYAVDASVSDSYLLLNGSPKVLTVVLPQQTNTTNTSNVTQPDSNTTLPVTVSASATLFMENTKQIINTTNTTTTNTTTTNTTTTTTSTTSTDYGSLLIDRVKINCNKLTTVTEGANINAAPGQLCNLTVKVKNTGSRDIEDIFIEADPDNSDVDGDSADISSLDSGDYEEEILELSIDSEAEDGEVEVTLTAEGEDDRGVMRSDTFTFTLEIERSRHDLQITNIFVVPKEAKLCEVSRIDVTVYVENKGQDDEDAAAVELSVPGLGFVKKTSVYIGEGEEQRIYFSIPVSSKSSAGTFKAAAKSFYDTVVLSDSLTADIVALKCEQKQEVANLEPLVVIPPRIDGENDTVYVPPAEEQGSGWFGSAVLTGVLVLANLVALTVLGVMAYGYFKKPEFEEQYEDNKPVEEFKIKDYY